VLASLDDKAIDQLAILLQQLLAVRTTGQTALERMCRLCERRTCSRCPVGQPPTTSAGQHPPRPSRQRPSISPSSGQGTSGVAWCSGWLAWSQQPGIAAVPPSRSMCLGSCRVRKLSKNIWRRISRPASGELCPTGRCGHEGRSNQHRVDRLQSVRPSNSRDQRSQPVNLLTPIRCLHINVDAVLDGFGHLSAAIAWCCRLMRYANIACG
jgi:hypothetical protein